MCVPFMTSYEQAKHSRDAGFLLIAADWINKFAKGDNEDETPPKKKRRSRKQKTVGVELDSDTRETALQVESIIRKVRVCGEHVVSMW